MADNFYTTRNIGLSPGWTAVSGNGNNPTVDIGTVPEDVWTGGGVYPWPSAITSLEVLSSSALDTAAGTGARSVVISGLNASYVEVEQTVALNGVTPVAVPTQLLRVNRVIIGTAGATGINQGTLTVRIPGPGATLAIIPIGWGNTRSSGFTVPAGKTLLVTSYLGCINRPTSVRDCTITSLFRSPDGSFRLGNEVSIDGNPFTRDLYPPVLVPAMTDLIFRVNTVSANGTDVTAAWTGILKDV